MAIAVMFHGGLLPFTHANTYDAFIHMFFGDHYHRSWFDPWEPRWYTGFVTTSYPPGTHMMIAALQHIMPLRSAFVIVQLTGLLLLTVGVFRFALIWVSSRASGYAALMLVLASSISETLHLFGQLPTIFSLGIFLNGLPYFHRWIVSGKPSALLAAVIFSAATTAAHHVTTIFGGVLFVLPIALHSIRVYGQHHPASSANGWLKALLRYRVPVQRGALLATLMILAVAVTIYPYWYWSITDPITQVPIPHGSRESFIERPDLGIVFFLIPWGMSLLILPYAFYKGATTALWPLAISLALCLLLGTGGTTPIPRLILRGAFDILTLDRFTFWGSILILPFAGLLIEGLLHGRSRQQMRIALSAPVYRMFIGGFFASMAGLATLVAIMPTFQPTQPDTVDPDPMVTFLEEDKHYRWRYLTLGLGDQFAYISSRTTAQSVDGNYHSARRLPDMTRFSVERLENAKYLGVPGLGSLKQFLVNADQYHLKYVFSNDEFYDPLLHFSGWNQVTRLRNGLVVWEKPNIEPLPLHQPRQHIPVLHSVMWGVLPTLALGLALICLVVNLVHSHLCDRRLPIAPAVSSTQGFRYPGHIRRGVQALAILILFGAAAGGIVIARFSQTPAPPADVVETYFKHLDLRRFHDAYDLLAAEIRPPFEAYLFGLKWQGGLLNSYGKLESVDIEEQARTDSIIDFSVTLTYITSLERISRTLDIRTIKHDDHWKVVPPTLQATQTPARLQRQAGVEWNRPGRRQPRYDMEQHDDRLDRPNITLESGRLVKHSDRFSVIGRITNRDNDPAAISVLANIMAGDSVLSSQSAGIWGGQRLLPSETAGFRVEFDGVLSLTDAEASGSFDPEFFLPPEFDEAPDDASIEVRSQAEPVNLYRSISINGLAFSEADNRLEASGLVVNTGTDVASIVRVGFLLYDANGLPLWMDAGFLESNLYPGQSAPFEITLPHADEIDIIADIDIVPSIINGRYADTSGMEAQQDGARIPLEGIAGFDAVTLHLSAMTYAPLF
ncbi:hypothetical protein LL947_02435 [Halomonas sp. BLK-85]